MFCKKNETLELPPISKTLPKDSANIKELNHEFFLLVRDQKYEQAYAVGTMYLHYHPENQAIQQFCYFIKHNRQELRDMVDQEQNYTDEQSEEQDEEEEEKDEEDDEDDDQTNSVVSRDSKVSVQSVTLKGKSVSSASTNSLKSIKSLTAKQSGKENKELCRGHKWDHNCKNKDCPNRKKQQK